MRPVSPSRTVLALIAGVALTAGTVGTLGANASSEGGIKPVAEGGIKPVAEGGVKPVSATTFKAFDAMVALSGCSGGIVRFPGNQDSDKALVLTNGHCTKPMPKPNTFVYQRAVNEKATILRGDVATKVADLGLDQLVYATMTGTDIGIYRSTATYAELKAKGVEARVMSTEHPKQGTQISIPSGYWKKNYTCTLDESVYQIREGGYVWNDSFRHSCSTIHGTSGTPVIDRATGVVIAINNTGSDDGEHCTMNNPCEVDQQGKITIKKGQNYGQQTYQINACFEAGTINLSKPGCTLYGARA